MKNIIKELMPTSTCKKRCKGTLKRMKVLCIGNSITIHEKCRYWWDKRGMCATTRENDYIHQLLELLGSKMNIVIKAVNFSIWEMMANDRAEVMPLIRRHLTTGFDLVATQLGENVKDQTTFEDDFLELLEYIRKKSYKAKILIIGNIWENKELEEKKKNVAEKAGVIYISLQELWATEYQAGMGISVQGDDGCWKTVEHQGVAKHPGDKAMRIIAERIKESLD